MDNCKTSYENYICPIKFSFNLIQSNVKKIILFSLFISIFFTLSILIAGTFAFVLANKKLGEFIFFSLLYIIFLIIFLIFTSHFIYVAKLFTKNIDEAIKVYKETPFFKSFSNLGTVLGVSLGLFLISIILEIISKLISSIDILYFIFEVIMIFLSPMVIGYVLTSKNFKEGFIRSFYYFNFPLIKSYLNSKYIILVIIYVITMLIIGIIFYIGLIFITLPFIFTEFSNQYIEINNPFALTKLITAIFVVAFFAAIFSYVYLTIANAFNVASTFYKKEDKKIK